MISRIKKLKMPIVIYGSGLNPNALVNWGDVYYSKLTGLDFVPKEFTLYFPETPVSIKKVKTMTADDVFPDDWSLFVSNDNKTFINIIKNHTMCNKKDEIVFSTTKKCNTSKSITYHEATLVDNYYYFVKFTMQANTYYHDNSFKDLITFKGFELFGNFLYVYNHCTPKRSNSHNYLIILTSITAASM